MAPEIESALSAVVPTRDITLDSPDAALKVMTRRLKDANVYLFFNERDQAMTHSVTLKGDGKTVQAWDPATGAVSTIASKTAKGAVTVSLALQPYETRLLAVR